jgi:CheY-specific phosphatase CheX
MPPIDVQRIFLESASEVLETMFFTGVADENLPEDSAALICAELTFRGSPSGRFGVRLPVKTGRLIAASFLGLDESEIDDRQVADVVCELTNMFCGSVLSRVEAGARFELMHPEIDPSHSDWRQIPNAVGCTLGIEEGTVTLWMCTNEQRPALVA